MNTYTRSLILAAMAAISLSQGCSCSDSKGSGGQVVIDPPVNPDPDPVVVTIGGMAAKGLIYGGLLMFTLLSMVCCWIQSWRPV